MINFSKFDSLFSLVSYFSDEKKCRQAIVESRWPDGDIICPHCGKHHCTRRKDGRFCCSACNHNFTELVGTIFENTKLPLYKWFMAMYLISSHKKGISSHQLGRDIGVTQKTAWFMLHKVRILFAQNDSYALEEDIECDEAYIGGQEKFKHESKKTEKAQGRSLKTKTPVFGMVQRNGDVVAIQTKDTKSNTIIQIIRQFCKEGSRVFTDEYIGYNSLVQSEYKHKVIKHGEKQYVIGDSHTNTIEGFWSQLKRAIYGIYHHVSADYLQRYVDEAVFRYNTRKKTESYRFEKMFRMSLRVVEHRDIKYPFLRETKKAA